jgi:hypothetical protein
MSKAAIAAMVLAASLAGTRVPAGEHPGEHPGSGAEHPGTGASAKALSFTSKEIKEAMTAHIKDIEKKQGGVCSIRDDVEGKDWTLKFVKLHDPVRVIDGKTAFACADFVAMAGKRKTKTKLDLDFWLEPDASGALKVVATKIHKVNGKPRFTYDGNKLVAVKDDGSCELPLGTAARGAEHPGQGAEHPGSGAEHPGSGAK